MNNSKIPLYLVPFLWAGFTIRARSFKGYGRWLAERDHLANNMFPPSEQWFTPLLTAWIGSIFYLMTGRKQRWVSEVFRELCEEQMFEEFREVKGIGQMQIQPGFVFVKRHDGYWFTINETWPGCVYIHYSYHNDRDSIEDPGWKLAYRVNWKVHNVEFMPTLEKLAVMLNKEI